MDRITLRREQLHALQASLRERLHTDLLKHVGEHFPSATGDLAELISEAMTRAERYGLHAERDLYQFVNLSVALGPRFDEESWVKEYLTDSFVTDPGQRLHRLYEEVLRRMESDS